MNAIVKKGISLLLGAICLLSSWKLVSGYIAAGQSSAANEEALLLAAAPTTAQTAPPETLPPAVTESREPQWIPAPVEEDENMEILAAMDLQALREVNEDVIGWILIPGTQVNFPLLQGADNEQYLHTTWDLQENVNGSIFLECLNDPKLTDFHSIVYGHNMLDGSMFHCITDYSSYDHYALHPYVYIATADGVYRYEIFSSYLADTDSSTFGLSFRQTQTRKNFIEMALEESVIDTGIVPEITDRILTLSTCSGATYATRWVVHARLPMILE